METSNKPVALVIDDESDFCASFATVLSRYFEVIPCDYSWEILSEIGPDHVDVIISDFYMTGTSGLDLIEALKKKYPSAPLVVMTGGMWGSTEEKNVLDAGAELVAYKPFGDISALVSCLQSLVENPASCH